MLQSLLFLALAPAHAGWPTLLEPPPSGERRRHDAAVVVGIEDYSFVSDIQGAGANADAWHRHLTQGLGIPSAHVHLLRDQQGTDVEVKAAIAQAVSQASANGRVWFVWIGHGAPAPDGQDGLLVGVDAQQSAMGLASRSLRRSEVLELLARGPQADTVVVLDACFSGRTPGGDALVPGLQPVLPIYDSRLSKGQATVLSAARGDQFAGPLLGASRPAFSYLLLGAMRGWGDANHDGAVTADEAIAYAKETLLATVHDRVQQPERLGGDGGLALGRAVEPAPDLGAIVLSAGPPTASTRPPPPASASLWSEGTLAPTTDARTALQRAEAEAARLRATVDAQRAARLDAASAALQAEVSAAWAVTVPLVQRGGPEAQLALDAFLKTFGHAKVSVDGVSKDVVLPEVMQARRQLKALKAAPRAPEAPTGDELLQAQLVGTRWRVVHANPDEDDRYIWLEHRGHAPLGRKASKPHALWDPLRWTVEEGQLVLRYGPDRFVYTLDLATGTGVSNRLEFDTLKRKYVHKERPAQFERLD